MDLELLKWFDEELEAPPAAGAMSGTTALTFGQSGALTGAGALAGTTALSFGQTGTLTVPVQPEMDQLGSRRPRVGRGPYSLGNYFRPSWESIETGLAGGPISGITSLTFGQTGTLAGSGALAGTAALTFGQSGAVTGAGALAGSTALTFGQSGALTGAGTLLGSTALMFDQTGALTGAGALAGTTTLTFGASATADLPSGGMSGTATLTFAQTGLLVGAGTLVGLAAVTFDQTGLLTGSGALTGTVGMVFGASATADLPGAMSGTASLSFNATGTLTGTGTPQPEMPGGGMGGGGSIDRRVRRKLDFKLNKILDDVVAEVVYKDLVTTDKAKAAAKVVKPFVETKAESVPEPAAVDWDALTRNAKAVGELLQMWRAIERQREIEADDEDWMMF